jgi:hypothetical protein
MTRGVDPDEDIAIFANNCVFMRSIYLHGRTLFETSSVNDRTRAAPTFFGDLNKMFVEYMILQVCKITDPAQDFRKTTITRSRFFLGTMISAPTPRRYNASMSWTADSRRSVNCFCRRAISSSLIPTVTQSGPVSHLAAHRRANGMDSGSICNPWSAPFMRKCSGHLFTSTASRCCQTPTDC